MTIHPHSSANTYFIYCVGQSLVKINAFKAAMTHSKITAKPLLGRYKGQDERSFISSMSNYDAIAPWLNAEESILHIHSFDARDRPKATLRYLANGAAEYLGRLVPVERSVALRADSYTYDITYKTYFICRSEDEVDQKEIHFNSSRVGRTSNDTHQVCAG
jgi:hypothetical protein